MVFPTFSNVLIISSKFPEKIHEFKENIGGDGNLMFSHSVPINNTNFLTGKMMSQWGVIGDAKFTKQNAIIYHEDEAEEENLYSFKLEFVTLNGYPHYWLKKICYKYNELDFYMESFFNANILNYNNIIHMIEIKNDALKNRKITSNLEQTIDKEIQELGEYSHKSITNEIIHIYDTSNIDIDENTFITLIRCFESYVGEATDRISQLFDIVSSHLIMNDYIESGLVIQLKYIAENAFIEEMQKRKEVGRRLELSSFLFNKIWKDLPANQDIKSMVEDLLIDI